MYTLESGIIFHSIFIGVTMGSTSGESLVRSLGIALMFHQANEVRMHLRDAQSGSYEVVSRIRVGSVVSRADCCRLSVERSLVRHYMLCGLRQQIHP